MSDQTTKRRKTRKPVEEKQEVKQETKKGAFDFVGESMTSAHTEVDKHLTYWLPLLNLDTWNVSVNFEPEISPHRPECIASMNASWCYKEAAMTCYLPNLAKMKDRQIEYVVVHELCHVMVCMMRNRKSKVEMEEAVVTELAKSFMRTKYPDWDGRTQNH